MTEALIWMLLVPPGQAGIAAPVFNGSPGGIRTTLGSPGECRLESYIAPAQAPGFTESARHAADQAYRILWREGYLRCPVTLRLLLQADTGASWSIQGDSAQLAIALALLQVLARSNAPQLRFPDDWRRPSAPISATGCLAANGNVQRVDGIREKIDAALRTLAPGATLFYPRANDPEIGEDLRHAARLKGLRLHAVQRLDEAINALGLPLRISSGEPYRGLLPFEFEHFPVYFGRDREVREVVSRLVVGESKSTPRLLVVGASGSGKSSFLQAGVLPHLAHAALIGHESLRERPVEWSIWRPREALGTGTEAASLTASLDSALAPETPDHRRVLVIDQLEELFTLGFSAADADALSERLLSLQREGTWVLATLRNDFYRAYQKHRGLCDVFAGGHYDLRPLDTSSLREIIEGPATVCELKFEAGLVTRIAEDVRGQPDALPLLEFAMSELYAKRSGMLLAHAAYEAIGGLSGAIAGKADTALMDVDEAARKQLPRLLRMLVSVADGETVAARPVELDFEAIDVRLASLLQSLLRPEVRLLVAEDSGMGTRLRIVHEALLTRWSVAEELIRHDLESIKIRTQIERDLRKWKENSERSDLLIPPGVRLAEAELLLQEFRAELSADMTGFIESSVSAERIRQESALHGEQERLRQAAEISLRKKKQTQIVALLLAVAALISSALGIWALDNSRQAERHLAESRASQTKLSVEQARLLLNSNQPLKAFELLRNLDISVLDSDKALANDAWVALSRSLYIPGKVAEIINPANTKTDSAIDPSFVSAPPRYEPREHCSELGRRMLRPPPGENETFGPARVRQAWVPELGGKQCLMLAIEGPEDKPILLGRTYDQNGNILSERVLWNSAELFDAQEEYPIEFALFDARKGILYFSGGGSCILLCEFQMTSGKLRDVLSVSDLALHMEESAFETAELANQFVKDWGEEGPILARTPASGIQVITGTDWIVGYLGGNEHLAGIFSLKLSDPKATLHFLGAHGGAQFGGTGYSGDYNYFFLFENKFLVRLAYWQSLVAKAHVITFGQDKGQLLWKSLGEQMDWDVEYINYHPGLGLLVAKGDAIVLFRPARPSDSRTSRPAQEEDAVAPGPSPIIEGVALDATAVRAGHVREILPSDGGVTSTTYLAEKDLLLVNTITATSAYKLSTRGRISGEFKASNGSEGEDRYYWAYSRFEDDDTTCRDISTTGNDGDYYSPPYNTAMQGYEYPFYVNAPELHDEVTQATLTSLTNVPADRVGRGGPDDLIVKKTCSTDMICFTYQSSQEECWPILPRDYAKAVNMAQSIFERHKASLMNATNDRNLTVPQ